MNASTCRGVRLLIVAVFAHVAPVVSARGGDSGTASGTVFDPVGMPVAQAVVRIAGGNLPAGRTMQTTANGTYRFEYLVPGDYTIDVEKSGVRARRALVVGVGKDTYVEMILGPTVTEVVTVAAATPIVDVRSTEVSFNFKAETLNMLPLERTYRGMFQLLPGVADNRSPVGPSAGGSRQDNTYLIDGANITNPAFGNLGTDVNELDIAEVNLKRAGITAEFGRTSGAVTNAVSRSGTNQLAGIGRFDWLTRDLVGAYALPDDLRAAGVRPGTFRDLVLTTVRSPALGVGGPLWRDRAFFYASARHFRETKWDRVNKIGSALPDEARTGRELYGKVTATPAESHQLTVSYRDRPNTVHHAGINNSDFAASVATTNDNGSRIATAEWANFMGASRSLNVRYLHTAETNHDVPETDLGYRPPFNPGNLAAMGQYVNAAQANLTIGGSQYTNLQNYRRHEVRGTFSQSFDLHRSRHLLKAGAGYELAEETFNRLANGWGLIANVTQSGVPALRTRYFTPQAAQHGLGRTVSLFVQDDLTLTSRLSANLGILLNRDEFSQTVAGSRGCPSTVLLKGGAAVYESHGDRCDFLRFGFGDEIQPRLGVSYQVRHGQGDKAYANWGRYYNMDQKSSARSLAPTRIFQTDTVFDLSGNVLSSGPLASTTGKMIDPDIRPVHTNEILVGYAVPFANLYSADVFFMSRDVHDFIEDVPSRMNGTAPNSGPFVAANLPCVRFAACQAANARREYRAMTASVRRQLSGGWMGDISYTWSRFVGNADYDYSSTSVFNTSSFIQDGPGANVEDPNRFGPLFEDRPHVFKLFAAYAVTDNLTASTYFRVQSGAPWTARARDWPGAVLNFLEPAGSHRNPTWTNLDVMAAYRLPVKGRARISLEARVLNVFDTQTRLSTDSQQYLDVRMVSTPPYFAPYLQPNPFFATGNSFAPPRRLYLAVVGTF